MAANVQENFVMENSDEESENLLAVDIADMDDELKEAGDEAPEENPLIRKAPSIHSINFGDEDQVQTASHIFEILDQENTGKVSSGMFLEILEECGIQRTDPRLELVMEKLNEYGAVRRDVELSLDNFVEVLKGNSILISKAMKGHLVIPDFGEFCEDIEKLYNKVADNEEGAVADYIPVLAQQDPSIWSCAVCTIDGQEWCIGNKDYRFCIQSCCKPIAYLIAAQELGFDVVHHHIGREPSGESFNKLHLKDYPSEENPNRKVPHNPMINAGAIMSCSLIARDKSMAERFSIVMDVWRRLSGNAVGFSNPCYLSEKATADRNWCLGYMMQEYDSFPTNTNLRDTLEFYFQQCSIEANIQQMAQMAATLANGGTNPQTRDKIFDPSHVRNCLSLMLSSGMYDFSGEWGFTIGLPAKSGVAGCVWLVVPNKVGIATFSPRLDECGNSARGVAFCKELVKVFNFHQFDNLRGVTTGETKKKDPTLKRNQTAEFEVNQIMYAAYNGDLNELMRLQAQGADLFASDYDYRSGLHLACSEGHLHLVKLFIMYARRNFSFEQRREKLSCRDRWGRTPLDDAFSGNHDAVSSFLLRHGAKRGAGAEGSGMDFAGKTDKPIPQIVRRHSEENLLANKYGATTAL